VSFAPYSVDDLATTKNMEQEAETNDEQFQTSSHSLTFHNTGIHELENAEDSDAWSEDENETCPSGETDTMMFPLIH